MPCHPCKHPTCCSLVPRPGYCDEHRHLAPKVDRREYHRAYDRHRRNPEAVRFYHSTAWQNAREIKLASAPVCEECRRAWAEAVHHEKPLEECTHAEAIDQDNLKSVCNPCHGKIEARVRAAKGAA